MKTTAEHVARTLYSGLLMILASCTPLSSADELAKPGSMIIYSDVAGASEILSTQYVQAIEIMSRASAEGEAGISLLNNLCVAYTLAGKLELARRSCDRVIDEAAQWKNYDDLSRKYNSARTMRRYISRAHVNRSILRSISGDTNGAAQDWAHVRARDKQLQ